MMQVLRSERKLGERSMDNECLITNKRTTQCIRSNYQFHKNYIHIWLEVNNLENTILALAIYKYKYLLVKESNNS